MDGWNDDVTKHLCAPTISSSGLFHWGPKILPPPRLRSAFFFVAVIPFLVLRFLVCFARALCPPTRAHLFMESYLPGLLRTADSLDRADARHFILTQTLLSRLDAVDALGLDFCFCSCAMGCSGMDDTARVLHLAAMLLLSFWCLRARCHDLRSPYLLACPRFQRYCHLE